MTKGTPKISLTAALNEDIQVQEYMDAVFEGNFDDIRNDIGNILQQDRMKTAEINLLTRENRMQREALQRIKESIVLVFNLPSAAWSILSLAELREIAQKALDWKASDPE